MDSADDSGHLCDSDPPDETGPTWCVSPVGSRVMQRHVARTLMSQDAARMAGREDAGWVYYDTVAGDNGPPVNGPQKTAADPRGGGGRISGQWSCSAPGPRRGNSVDCFPTKDDN